MSKHQGELMLWMNLEPGIGGLWLVFGGGSGGACKRMKSAQLALA